jgi:hypothetical protein
MQTVATAGLANFGLYTFIAAILRRSHSQLITKNRRGVLRRALRHAGPEH